MNPIDLKNLIEATLLAAGRPVTEAQMLELFDERERPTPEQLKEALAALAADYETRGIELCEVASGWRIQIRTRCVDLVSRLWQERVSRYSRALLETLALVAYRQPITRSEIEEIRGVAISSSIMRTMQERNWIRVVGHREVPGRPELLGTTKEFLDYFGLRSLDQLPTLAQLRDLENVGVQLELPAGDVAAANEVQGNESQGELQGETQSEAQGEAQGEVQSGAESDTESEMQVEGSSEDDAATLSAESDNEGDPEAETSAPTMVADAEDKKPGLYAPPAE